jgi:hypothetical protein
VPQGSSESLREQRKEAARQVGQTAADLAERMLENGEKINSTAGRMKTLRVDGHEYTAVYTLKITRKS